MFISPSKIKQNRMLKGRTISFETVKKQYGNLVLIPTLDKKGMTDTIASTLFRPTQLMALYTKRRIKPQGRQAVTVNQKDYYTDIRTETNGRIRKCKTMIAAYNAQNIIYDIYNEYTVRKEVWERVITLNWRLGL